MPMKIIAVHDDPTIAGDKNAAESGADAAGYKVISSFANSAALLSSVQAMLDANNNDCLAVLEIVAHGFPTDLDGILWSTAASFGAQLKTLRLCDVCDIYMSGCNTAINRRGIDSVTQVVSSSGPTIADDNVMLTMHGTIGYIAGLHMNGDEYTVGNRGGAGAQGGPKWLSGYPDAPDSRGGPGVNIGSQTAIGAACWRSYREGRRVL